METTLKLTPAVIVLNRKDHTRIEQMAKSIRENHGMDAGGWPGIAECLRETYHELA